MKLNNESKRLVSRGRWAACTMLGLAIGAMSLSLIGPSCEQGTAKHIEILGAAPIQEDIDNERFKPTLGGDVDAWSDTDGDNRPDSSPSLLDYRAGGGLEGVPVTGSLYSLNGGRDNDEFLFSGMRTGGDDSVVDYSFQGVPVIVPDANTVARGGLYRETTAGSDRAVVPRFDSGANTPDMVTSQGGTSSEEYTNLRIQTMHEQESLGNSALAREIANEILEWQPDNLEAQRIARPLDGLPDAPFDPNMGQQQRLDQARDLVRQRRFAEHQEQIQLAQAQAKERGWQGRVADELWVIEKPRADLPPSPEDNIPGCGALVCRFPGPVATTNVPVPLKHTDVRARILGYIASVNVTQTFHNPYDSKIEAVYVFPLPQNAAVSDFLMTIGDRTIRGVIRERQEAQRIYERARAQGHVASLLTQERANIFTQKVANIEPNKQIDIDITYFNTLDYRDNGFEFVFPMVVGPRFNPPGSTTGVAAVERGALPGDGGQDSQISYLRPEERSGHDISVEVALDAGVSIETIASRTHAVDVQPDAEDPSKALIRLSSSDSIPNRDFVLRWEVAGDSVKTGVLVQTTDLGTYANLMLVPPASLESCKRGPVEMVFVLDCSGSMSGQPMTQAKLAAKRALRRLQPGDSFQIIRFSNNASQLGEYPVEATPANLERGISYLENLAGSGGTMMVEGIKAALDFPHDVERTRYVVFLTDGYIGNENEILGAVHDRLGPARIFSFGVGSSTNRMLMHRMAKIGRGVVAFLDPSDSPTEVMDLFMDRIEHAALTDIQIDMPTREMPAIYPSRLPDVFVGRPVMITMQIPHAFAGPMTIRGRAGGEDLEFHVTPQEITADGDALPRVFARARIADLMDRMSWDKDLQIPGQIRETALAYGMMSQYTAFVAVDSLSRTDGDSGTTVPVPVPVPEGVKYSTTVPSR